MKKLLIALTIIPIYSMQDSKNEIIPNIKIAVHKASPEEKKTRLPGIVEDPEQKKLRRYPNIGRTPHFFVSSPITDYQRYRHAIDPNVARIYPVPAAPQPVRCRSLKCIVGSLCAGATAMGAVTGFIYWFNYYYNH